ncbi:MAG: LysM peptidoglycan-binding domain-containing protein [Candidatus Marinimicrobia bacterium]|jgi:nucleoid-associated protein YgaU|nr:LysM peptidoglycan-binding domain-containing protein [Candidatus Neomarinimicrobiota bacterium]MBT3675684.1 LysM peptidoglycan-binding domain-containing protein [Candidatus Neomarinimicrobiota bacterium]MBT3763724.1 LysM peptidoglycan-binding domain-containing protein [Candidatus Neomarinimicrobiota bacterium]MBT4068352.1 LysM peptidoglycan-binding domain-containing protein [Candidatus Neomarinimicrobiota bacterium]MBT4271065.1 LysM peptidoglycan-binding domain-containing protein [Candidatus
MKKILASVTLLFIVSCGKQTAPALELQDTDATQNSSEVKRAELPTPQEATFAAKPEVIEETNSTDIPEHGPAADVDKDKKIVSEKPKKEIKVDPEVLFPDFAWEKQMIEPGDFLIKIAKREYGDFRLWRQIYAWNKNEIGENPNIIFPYHFLNLQKERLSAKTAEPTYTEYTVQTGDNLWNIAGNKYGDAKSWIILLWDNEETIKANAGILNPGMTLKLREKLDPNA